MFEFDFILWRFIVVWVYVCLLGFCLIYVCVSCTFSGGFLIYWFAFGLCLVGCVLPVWVFGLVWYDLGVWLLGFVLISAYLV